MAKKRSSRRSRASRSSRRGNLTRGTIREMLTVGHKLTPAERHKYDALLREFSRPLVWKSHPRDVAPDNQVARAPFGGGSYSVGTFGGGRPGHLVLLGFDHSDGRGDLLGSFPNIRAAKAHAAKNALEKAKWAALDRVGRR